MEVQLGTQKKKEKKKEKKKKKKKKKKAQSGCSTTARGPFGARTTPHIQPAGSSALIAVHSTLRQAC